MARTVSISRRLTLLLTGGIVLLWLLAALLSFLVMREEMDEVFDSALEETAQWLLPLATETLRQLPQPEAPSAQDEEDHDKYLTFQLRSRDGTVLLRSRDAPQEPFTETIAPGFAQTDRHKVYTAAAGDYFVQVAEPVSHRHEAVMESAGALLLPVAVLVPISIFLILWSVRRGLAPMRRLQGAIGARGGGNLQPIAETVWPEEIAGTVQAVNRLLLRLRSALEAERVFAATSAHELRTPVATALAQTQRLLTELEAGPSRDRGRRIEAALRRLGALVEKLLHLSRAEAGVGLSETENDLLAVLRLVIEEFAMEPEVAGRLSLSITDGVSLQARMDIDAFSIVVRNLIENALAYGDPGTLVEIAVPDNRTVRVLNACPPVPVEVLSRLTQRFVRGGQIKNGTEGSGLGLAIVEMILQQTGGTLDLVSPVAGRSDGFEARVTLPG
ncbi:MAG: sensor histidine kinase N-terminal domain-containing protein [Alphaproteobacteria bacterium]|nr:sensor histidine kinase N-terminal domain-containing protein [Alphaproteobacteria bacterium]MBU0799218.1 sensor histidine kinase N-terminal domain-containing protein [Alphaproteobacteria bacterium]MBU0887531.1 sensor histidine kinase N-terminal domain-containing protein [Alphaproteobacteria bacterium]MBU1814768.1 sensor histidine kinase N-terminal domain-containing protein [Alphaproteobacteria bacterium]